MRFGINNPDNRRPLHPHADPGKKLACEKQGKISVRQRPENLWKLHLLMNAKLVPAKVFAAIFMKKRIKHLLLDVRLSISSSNFFEEKKRQVNSKATNNTFFILFT
jgi:hypothetical protein